MQIKCPICGEVCESDVVPDVGQHLQCPFCNGKFQYTGERFVALARPNSPARLYATTPRLVISIRHAHKFCRECGNEMDINAIVCPQCGVPVTARNVVASGGVQVPNHMVAAILITVFCCVIFGIVAMVYASQVNTKLAQGDIEGAQSASRAAYGWIIAGFCVGLVVSLLYLVAVVFGA